MKKLLVIAAVAWISIGVVTAAGWIPTQTPIAVNAEQAAAPAAQRPAQRAAAQTPPAAPAAAAPAQAAPPVVNPAEYKAMVKTYCTTCHNERGRIPAGAPLALDLADLDDPSKTAEVWEKVIRKIGIGAMPPQGMPTPGAPKLAEFRTWLAGQLDRAAVARGNPGQFVVHRLNRLEYANAMRDLLGLEVDTTELLPSDGGDFGFDNIASALNTSPLLLERYLTAALRVSALAVGDTTVPPGATVYPISLGLTQNGHLEGLPLGTRGGVVVKHHFPADADYVLGGRLHRTILNGYAIQGLETPHQFVIAVDGEQVYSGSIGGDEDHKLGAEDAQKQADSIDARMTGRAFVTAGLHEVAFTWIERPAQAMDVWQPALRASQEVHLGGGLPRLKRVSVEGPYNVTGVGNSPSRQKLFVCTPASTADEPACAQQIISTLAKRAYRRPVTADDLAAPMAFYNQARSTGDFDAGIRAGAARVLASPNFIYRVERSPENLAPGAAHRITELELASRLSFFLWNSIPDDELLNLAIAGKLRAPGVLAQQVRRMVRDERADSMVASFTGQWLQLRNLESRVSPDLLLFPDFDDNLRKAFRRETEMFFGYVMRENRPALELLTADYTFANERLARHYGIDGVIGARYRRVQLPDPNRRGLLGQGSLLALTSIANRTSPVIRGKFVLSTLLNTPPLPPPTDIVIPPLERSAAADRPSTVREQLEKHRANAVCSACHRNMDPIGFALENFDSDGSWRATTREGLKVDTAGVLVDGTKVDGPIGLRNALLARGDVFVGTVTENMLIYALGRGLEPSDMATVRSIVRSARVNNYRFMSIIQGIVDSRAFQMRTKPALPGSGTVVAQAN